MNGIILPVNMTLPVLIFNFRSFGKMEIQQQYKPEVRKQINKVFGKFGDDVYIKLLKLFENKPEV